MGGTVEHGVPVGCARTVPAWLVALDNAPTAALFALGAAILARAWWPLAAAYLAWCAASIVLFWALICPSCHHWGTRACPCGYGAIAPMLFARREGADFRRAFRRNIAVMFPGWLAPLMGGGYLLWTGPSQAIVILLAAFCAIGFAVIPAVSRLVGCRGCEIRDQCPWMGGG